MNSHITALHLVLEHISPSPWLLCRLARVSRAFHAVFTSDQAWQRINFLGVQTKIYQEYIAQCSKCNKSYRGIDRLRRLDCKCCMFELLVSPRIGDMDDMTEIHQFYLCSNDLELMRCMVRCNGMALVFASESLRDNEALVMEAVSAPLAFDQQAVTEKRFNDLRTKTPAPLMFASPRLRAMRHIVHAAVHRCGDSLHYASEKLQKEKEMQYAAADHYCYFKPFPWWPQVALADTDLLGVAVQRCGENMIELPKRRKLETDR